MVLQVKLAFLGSPKISLGIACDLHEFSLNIFKHPRKRMAGKKGYQEFLGISKDSTMAFTQLQSRSSGALSLR